MGKHGEQEGGSRSHYCSCSVSTTGSKASWVQPGPALTSTEKLLNPAQLGLLRGQHKGQDYAWVVGTCRPAKR